MVSLASPIRCIGAMTGEDLKDIKNPPMGTKAYIIHEKRIVIADSSGKFCDM